MSVQVSFFDQGRLARGERLLAGIPDGARRAAKEAMSRAVSHLRTNSAKAIRERYDISAANIRAGENVTVRYSHQDGVQAFVNFSGRKIPLYRYGGAGPSGPGYDQSRWVPVMMKGKWRMGHPGTAARGHQLKSTAPALFEGAFVARMGSGHVGIFERLESGRIREITGGSVPGMLGNEQVRDRLAEQAAEKFQERYEHAVLRLLNGWGG